MIYSTKGRMHDDFSIKTLQNFSYSRHIGKKDRQCLHYKLHNTTSNTKHIAPNQNHDIQQSQLELIQLQEIINTLEAQIAIEATKGASAQSCPVVAPRKRSSRAACCTRLYGQAPSSPPWPAPR